MKILDVRWFCGRDTIGIVRVETDHGGIQYYIGCGEGYSIEADTLFIAEWGSRFPYTVGDKLFGVENQHE